MRYRPDLDGLRAVAVLAVLVGHAGIDRAYGGWMGVDVFFVLSGFLITTLLLTEWTDNGRVALGRFYARRALRLYPALLLMIVLGAPFYRTLGDPGTVSGYLRTSAISGLYLQDLFAGLTDSVWGGFAHTWSLAIEEQFYLLWPPVLVLLLTRRRDPLPWAVGLTVLSWALLVHGSLHNSIYGFPKVYFLPWSRFSQLLLGCCVALLLHRRRMPAWVGRSAVGWAVSGTGVGLALVAGRLYRYPHLGWQAPAIGLVAAALLLHLDATTSSVRTVLGARPLAWIGRRSYGIYLFQTPVDEVMGPHLHAGKLVRLVVFTAVTFVIATLSYRFVETPFLRRKSRLRPAGQSDTGALSNTSAATTR